ncbi:PREDICTED: EH domain-containing protein 1-like [Branchiostoma belcheri]|uniref:EH domain-containing protein 1-like n=1 Tax=Branchiostoma belcheri TaxID=7741 RepID=A0A6P4YRZ1_BRABE|nr:PREDICTED: EH domain-containing protein 1-like [Branchiostoma belcheri]
MFSWMKSKDSDVPQVYGNVVEGLKQVYREKLYPLEEHYKFHDFHSPALDDPDFDAKPMVLLVGQYSTGKTTFIRYLLEREFPGIRIGPEPTTDRFIAVMHSESEGVIPGNALVMDPKKQFRPLSKFGNAFLNRFQCSQLPSPVLESLTFVDTPGILSGEKQRTARGYDFAGVLEWFAERVDRIILLFDAHKLDISDEFRRGIEALRGNDDKIRIVLNKSDMIDHQQLMRVYGALMWSLGKVINTPEVARVYIGSFWDQPLQYDINRRLFEAEEHDLFADLQSLPRNAALRKLNDLIKRARLAKVHAYIISHLRAQMPSVFGKDSKKKELIDNLHKVYDQIQREQQISIGDFPQIERMQEQLRQMDFSKFHTLKPKLIEKVDHMLSVVSGMWFILNDKPRCGKSFCRTVLLVTPPALHGKCVHVYIISHLRAQMPSVFGKDSKKKELIDNLHKVYDQIQREQQISIGDFPQIERMQEQLRQMDFSKFHTLKPKLIEKVDHMLSVT